MLISFFIMFDALYPELYCVWHKFALTAFFAFAHASVVVLLVLSILDHFSVSFIYGI